MNNAGLWLVVKPTVGIPLFLGAAAVGSFAVHTAVLTNTTWVADFLSGEMHGAQSAAITAPAEPTAASAVVVFDPKADATAGSRDAVVVLPDGRTAHVVFPSATAESPSGEKTVAAAPPIASD